MSQNYLYNENIFLFMILESKNVCFVVNHVTFPSSWMESIVDFTRPNDLHLIVYICCLFSRRTQRLKRWTKKKIKKNQNWLWINKWLNVKIYAQPSMERSILPDKRTANVSVMISLPKLCFQALAMKKQYLITLLDWPSKLDAFDKSWK